MDVLTKEAIRQLVAEKIENADAEGRRRYGTGRLITFKQEEVCRLAHQDHFGLPYADAADVAGTTVPNVMQKLARLAEVAPQLFPILTPLQAKVYRMFMEGYTTTEIATLLQVTERRIRKVLTVLHNGGQVYFRSDAGRRIGYNSRMDPFIKERW